MPGRRGLLLGSAAALGGCGFHPLYLPAGTGRAVGSELAAVYVPVEGERSGQLLRQALQRRLEGTGTGVAKKYELIAGAAITGEPIGIQRDTSTTRIRLNASGNWTLRVLNLEHTVLTSGTSHVLDGVNINNQEYFAVDLENEAATRRIAETLADQIVQQVAIYLRRRAAAG